MKMVIAFTLAVLIAGCTPFTPKREYIVLLEN
jgi:hypothetical protein